MGQFPKFTKAPANRIASTSQHTPGVEGYVFDGADGSQVALWECHADASTEEHVHEFDEYFLVVPRGSPRSLIRCLGVLESRDLERMLGKICFD
jgi:hypothetical protein